MMYSLNIGGVKRWLTLSNPNSSQESTPTKRLALPASVPKDEKEGKDLDSKNGVNDPIANAPWWTSPSLATRLMDPTVPLTEENEYKSYVEQFQPHSVVMVTQSASHSLASPTMAASATKFGTPSIFSPPLEHSAQVPLDTEETLHPDYSLFKAHVDLSSAPSDFASYSRTFENESPADAALYTMYSESANRLHRFLPSKHDVGRYEGYSRWVHQGVYGRVSSRLS